MKRELPRLPWGRVGRSLLGNALYFAGGGAASCAVLGCAEGALLGAMALRADLFFIGNWLLVFSLSVFNAFIGAGLGGIVNTLAALPSFAIAGVLRGAHPFDSQRDELARAGAAARRAAIVCGAAGVCTGLLVGCLAVAPGMAFTGALCGLICGNVAGIWLGAICPGVVEAADEVAGQSWRALRHWR